MSLKLSKVKLSSTNLQVRAIFWSIKPKNKKKLKAYLDCYTSFNLVLLNLFSF